jgi:hypothetical protein
MSVRGVLIYLAPPKLGVVAGYLLGGRLRHVARLAVNLRRGRVVSLTGAVVLAGAALNAVAILLNGAMPYSPTAARAWEGGDT